MAADVIPAEHPRTASSDACAGSSAGVTEDTMWDMSLDMMATASIEGFLTRVNPAWERTLGYTAEELLSRPYLDFVHPDDVDRTIAEARALSDSSHVSVHFENRYRHKDGGYRWLSWNSRLGPDDRTLYCLVREITERLRREEEIQQLNRSLNEQAAELRRSNRDLEQFAYVASHDLSEPLRAVTGYVQLLERRYRGRLDADADEYIAFAVDGVTRMQALIRDLLAYARAGTHTEATTVDCGELIATVVAGAREARPDAVFDVGPMPVITSEAGPLRQVFENLVSNAIKFMPPDREPRIALKSRHLNSAWEFQVIDNGIGIDPQYTERIFGMYQRLNARTAYAGTGIGLAICQRVVERLGGSISVVSTPGMGTTFTFTVAPGAKDARDR